MENFRGWLAKNESWGWAAEEMGATIAQPEMDHFSQMVQKIDGYVGISKFLKALPKTAYANFMFGLAFLKFVKNPTDQENQTNILHWMSESVKMGVYSGATIPLGAVLGGMISAGWGSMVGAILSKTVSYGYFYMGQWAERNVDHPKFGDFAKKIIGLMPKTMGYGKH